ncbi:MAG: hypothetical protein M3Z04_18140 [Chloroflexota bacterium]|nr:hypothetical protein [Chloroflexota bacterium]
MAQIKALIDEFGVIHDAGEKLPDDKHRLSFLEALAELEDNESHRTRNFPKTRLHRVAGITQAIYRADIDKISGWRIHIQFENGLIHLKDLIEGQRHDDVQQVIKSRINRYS